MKTMTWDQAMAVVRERHNKKIVTKPLVNNPGGKGLAFGILEGAHRLEDGFDLSAPLKDGASNVDMGAIFEASNPSDKEVQA